MIYYIHRESVGETQYSYHLTDDHVVSRCGMVTAGQGGFELVELESAKSDSRICYNCKNVRAGSRKNNKHR